MNVFTQLDAYPLPRMQAVVQNVAQNIVRLTLDLESSHHQTLNCSLKTDLTQRFRLMEHDENLNKSLDAAEREQINT